MCPTDPFLEYISRREYSSNREMYFDLLKSSNDKYGYLIPSLYHPYIIFHSEYNALKIQVEKLSKLLMRVPELYLKERKVSAFYDFPDELNEWIAIDPGYSMPVPISRYDGFWDGENFRFCEFNTDGTSGINDIRILDDSFLCTDFGKEAEDKLRLHRFDLPKSILEILIKTYGEFGGKGIPNIAITDYTEKGTSDEFLFLRDYFISEGYPTEICDLRNFELKKDGLWHSNFKVDLVYRRAVTDDIISYAKESKVFLEAYRKKAVCVVGPLRSHIIHSKKTFAFLYSSLSEKYFSSSEISFIRGAIPWTCLLSNSDIPLNEINKNKDEYFLKPYNSYATAGVVCGADLSQEEWQKAINTILETKDERYLIQKKIDIPRHSFTVDDSGLIRLFNVKLDPYVFGGKFCGFYTRISNKNIIALNHQGMLVPCFVSNAF